MVRPSQPREVDNGPRADAPTTHLHNAKAEAAEVVAYIRQYLATRVDIARLGLNKVLVIGGLGLIGLVISLTALGMSVAFLLDGLAEVIGIGLNNRRWAGNLIVGGGLIVIIISGSLLAIRWYFASSRTATIRRYERRHYEQRQAKGIDAEQRAHSGTNGDVRKAVPATTG